MTSRRRPLLSRQIARAGDSDRKQVAIEGRCCIGTRDPQDVMVTDLDPLGCRMRANAVGVIKAEAVKLWFGSKGPLDGRLEWIKGGALGVSFAAPLEDELLEALYDESLLSNVVALRR